MRPADKGLDGLRIDIDSKKGTVTGVVVFEDKATTKSRKTIREEVWPALAEFEAGKQDHVLVAELGALLELRPALDVDQIIKDILWKRDRHFRVSVTVSKSHATDKARKRLFSGFDSIVKGSKIRRAAETIEIAGLRSWMQTVATKAIVAINKMV
jgi:hypothetical protein